MILDGKNIEQQSTPLDRLDTAVCTQADAAAKNIENNNRFTFIEQKTMDNDTPEALGAFHARTCDHIDRHITPNGINAETDPTAHVIDPKSIARNMFDDALTSKVAFTDVANTFTMPNTVNNTLTVNSPSATGAALTVGKGVTSLKATTVGGDLGVTGAVTTSGKVTVNGSGSAIKDLIINGDLTVKGNLTTTVTTSSQRTDVVISDARLVINKGGTSSALSSAMPGIVVSADNKVADTDKIPRLFYNNSTSGDLTGWCVQKYNDTTIFPLASTTYVDNRTSASSGAFNTALTAAKKLILAGHTIKWNGTGSACSTYSGCNIVTLPSGFASTVADYEVFITPVLKHTNDTSTTTPSAALASLGEIQVIKMDTTRFRIVWTGVPSATINFSWLVINTSGFRNLWG